MWNQEKFITNIKTVGICEGYFNALSLQQAFNDMYGGVVNNPWKFISTSGSGISQHQREAISDLKEQGYKIVAALDSDEAGLKGLGKLIDADSITHFALTEDDEKDWNDLIQEKGHKQLAKLFLSKVVKVNK